MAEETTRELPLASVAKRLKRQRKISTRKAKVAPLMAQGYSLQRAAEELEVSKTTVARDLADPGVQEELKALRMLVKQQIMRYASDGFVKKVFEMASEKLDGREAKDFDATMRGLNALEKTTASASGEAQKLDLSATVTKVDRKELYARMEGILATIEAADGVKTGS